MKCNEIEKLLEHFFELNEDERNLLLEHCDICDKCRASFNTLDNFQKNWTRKIPTLTERDKIKILSVIHSPQGRKKTIPKWAIITTGITTIIATIIILSAPKTNTTNGYEFALLTTEELIQQIAQDPDMTSDFISEYLDNINGSMFDYFAPEELMNELSQIEQIAIIEKVYQNLW